MNMKRALLVSLVLLLETLVMRQAEARGKPCRRLCHEAIRSCVGEVRATMSCSGLRGAARLDCRHARRNAIHECTRRDGAILQTCYARPTLGTCSPSGAFIDAE